MIITPDTYRHLANHRDLADRIMSTYGWAPNRVLEMRVAEGCVEVDWFMTEPLQFHTARYTPCAGGTFAEPVPTEPRPDDWTPVSFEQE